MAQMQNPLETLVAHVQDSPAMLNVALDEWLPKSFCFCYEFVPKEVFVQLYQKQLVTVESMRFLRDAWYFTTCTHLTSWYFMICIKLTPYRNCSF